MGWKGQIADTQDMLGRIVALLLALADLAERAAGAPDARRRLALAILRSGKTVTRDAFCVAHVAHGRAGPAGQIAGDSPEDALALAASLRALALFLAATAARTGRSLRPPGCTSRRHADEMPDARRGVGPHVSDSTFLPVEWRDTS